MYNWNMWHGCHKISEGCRNCYVYRRDSKFGKDSSIVTRTKNFDLPIKRKKNGEYKLKANKIVYTCLTSDFFIEEADEWRKDIYKIIKERRDLHFFIITKRINRFYKNLPNDWKDGYDNVTIACTVENQAMANYRLPIYLELPIKHKIIICEPLLEKINLIPYFNGSIKEVIVGGESGETARLCDYSWVLDIRNQCVKEKVKFKFKQTGALFKKDNVTYKIARRYQMQQAKKANIDYDDFNLHA